MEKIYTPENKEEIASQEDLQGYLNRVTLDIPEEKRSLENPDNIDWLNNNLYILTRVPEKYRKVLDELFRENKRKRK